MVKNLRSKLKKGFVGLAALGAISIVAGAIGTTKSKIDLDYLDYSNNPVVYNQTINRGENYSNVVGPAGCLIVVGAIGQAITSIKK